MDDVHLPIPEGWGYLDALFLLRQQAEALVDACFADAVIGADERLVFYNEADAGFGDVAFAMKLTALLREHVPTLDVVMVSSAPEKAARFPRDPAVPLYAFDDYASTATAADRRPTLVLSAPGIFDNCRIKSQVYALLQVPEETPFLYLAEYGSIRQLKDDAFKGFMKPIDALIDAHLDALAAQEGVDPEDVGFHGRTGRCVVVEGDGYRSTGYLTATLTADRPDNPLHAWLTQPMLDARSAGIDVAEIGIFIDDSLQSIGAGRDRDALEGLSDAPLRDLLIAAPDRALYSGYAHSGFAHFISYVAAVEEGLARDIDIVMPNARTAAQAWEEIFDATLLARLGEMGVGEVSLSGNDATGDGLAHHRATVGEGKTLRLITRYPLPHTDMKRLLAASERGTIVSGDQSFSEAVSADKDPLVIEPVYCQTWVLDAQLALAERVDPRLKAILDFAMQYKWEDAGWEKVRAHLRAPDLAARYREFNRALHAHHRANTRAVNLIKRALLTRRIPALADAQARLFTRAWAGFDPARGLTISGADLTALSDAIPRDD